MPCKRWAGVIDLTAGKSKTFAKQKDVWCCAHLPSENAVLSGALDARLLLWDTETRSIIREMKGHEDAIWSVAVSPDGKLFASGSGGKLDDSKRMRKVATTLSASGMRKVASY